MASRPDIFEDQKLTPDTSNAPRSNQAFTRKESSSSYFNKLLGRAGGALSKPTLALSVQWSCDGKLLVMLLSNLLHTASVFALLLLHPLVQFSSSDGAPVLQESSGGEVASLHQGPLGVPGAVRAMSGTAERGSVPRDEHVCVEAYLAGGSDYGAAANKAIRAQPLKKPSIIATCLQGEHPVAETITLDRPILMDFSGSTLIPQPALASSPVITTATHIMAGNRTITVSRPEGLIPGMAVSGIGLQAGTTITRVDGNFVDLSLPPVIHIIGMPTLNSTIISGLTSMVGLEAGRAIIGPGISPGTTVQHLAPGTQSMEISNTVHSITTVNTYLGPATMPIVMTLEGSWTSSISAIATHPVIRWQYNKEGLHNQEGQMIGGAMRGVHIADPKDRSLVGVQGIQIYGWDRLKVDDLEVDNLRGSCLILGGASTPSTGLAPVNSVRESQFTNVELRDCGDPLTGQSSLEIMTPEVNGDRINQLKFIGLQVVFPYAEGVTIGSYAGPEEQGPALLWFMGNSQIEGGSHLSNENIDAPYDLIGIQAGYDIHFSSMEILSPGYGKAAIRVDKAYMVNVMDSIFSALQKGVQYRISVRHGSTSVKLALDPVHQTFPEASLIDGIGAILTDSEECSAGCPVWIETPESATNITLTAPYNGRDTSATLELSGGGYDIVNTGIAFQKSTVFANGYGDMDVVHLARLGLTNAGQMFYAGALPAQSYLFDSPSLGLLTLGGSAYLNGMDLPSMNTRSITAGSISTGTLGIGGLTAPTSGGTCTKGQIWTDTDFIYVCVAPNTIRRSVLSGF